MYIMYSYVMKKMIAQIWWKSYCYRFSQLEMFPKAKNKKPEKISRKYPWEISFGNIENPLKIYPGKIPWKYPLENNGKIPWKNPLEISSGNILWKYPLE